jgi:circadian clock protein KaiC
VLHSSTFRLPLFKGCCIFAVVLLPLAPWGKHRGANTRLTDANALSIVSNLGMRCDSMDKTKRRPIIGSSLAKAPTGVKGLDEITGGGFPRGRPTLLCGGAGAGKTLLAMEFLVRGAVEYNEPGVFMAFEETAADLTENVRSLGFDLEMLAQRKKLVVDYVQLEPGEIDETGDYDLEGLFIRLGSAIDTVGAKRVVLDTIENLFAGLQNEGILRAELRRLFRWLKEKGVTAVITAERGEGALTRQGLEEYVSDCVILLDHRVTDQLSIRRLRIVKYRGTSHGTNEYPFLIDEDGFSVLPVTSLGLLHQVSNGRISSGIAKLDMMLGGEGFYRGSTILVSGTAGTGKTSLSAHFVDAACRRGERCLYLSFEESPGQLIRNTHSIGLDLARWVKRSLLKFHSSRPTFYGLEMHLATVHKLVETFRPDVVVLDPIDSLIAAGNQRDANMMLIRLIDFLKLRQITAFFTNLTSGGGTLERTELHVSSLADTWLLMRDIEQNGERSRAMYVLKSRGMPHSNKLRKFLITQRGFDLLDAQGVPENILRDQLLSPRKPARKRHIHADTRPIKSSRTRKREALGAL